MWHQNTTGGTVRASVWADRAWGCCSAPTLCVSDVFDVADPNS